MTKEEYCVILKKLYSIELQIKSDAIAKRLGRGETELSVLAGKITALDFMSMNKKEQDNFKKDLDKRHDK